MLPIHYTGLLAASIIVVSAVSIYALLKGRLWIARGMARAAAILALASWAIYVYAFIVQDPTLMAVYMSSSSDMEYWLRIAASWSNGGGSLFLFSIVVLVVSEALRTGFRDEKRFHVATHSLVILGLLAAFLNDAFTKYEASGPGAGFNPLLKTWWVYPHPLSTFIGYALLAASSIALFLYPGSLKAYRVFVAGWATTTLGIVLGGMWSYDTFGWGGYWAWDPVETGELLVWLSSALVIHLRGPLARHRGPASLLVVSSILLALYITRTGLSPLHGFALPNIGAVVLLSASIAFLAWFLKEFAALWDKPGTSLRGLSLENAGFTVAGVALMVATFFVYGSMLTPSILTAMGLDASVPQWDSGVRYFNPPLYVLAIVMLLAMPASLAGKLLGRRGYLSFLLASISVLSVALAASKALPRIAPLSSQLTNSMIIAGLSVALLVAGLLLTVTIYQVYSYRLRGLRQALLNLVHLGLAILFVGVLVSGPVAYGRQYSIELYIRPGEEVIVAGDLKIRLDGFNYSLQEGLIDAYTPYAGKSKGFILAWTALREVSTSLDKLSRDYRAGEEALAQAPLMKLIVDSAGSNETIRVERLSINVSEGFLSPYVNGSSFWANGSVLELVNATIYFEVVPIAQDKVPPDTGIALAVNASQAVLRLPGPGPGNISGPYSATILPAEPVSIEVLLLGSQATLVVNSLALSSVNTSVTRDGSVLLDNVSGTLLGSLVGSMEEEAGLPLILVGPTSAYYHVKYGVLSWAKPFIENNGLYLDGAPAVWVFLGEEPGMIRVPKTLPEGAYLDAYITTIIGEDEYSARARLRFDANGELQGIRGLVPQVVHVWRGLTDVYITLYPPVTRAGGELVHELMIYYLSRVKDLYGDASALTLATIILAEYYPSPRSSSDLWSLARDSYYLYLEASGFDHSKSRIYTEGIRVEVKIIPGVGLVWLGSLLSIASALALAFLPYGFVNKSPDKRIR
ncbi:MAG: cytochrome c biogenesis protein CcsA [Desulfurococcales archaeon]|nr:cytochrome c biogenesis protein CcsA [Desulfurococcales archaeon]